MKHSNLKRGLSVEVAKPQLFYRDIALYLYLVSLCKGGLCVETLRFTQGYSTHFREKAFPVGNKDHKGERLLMSVAEKSDGQ